MRVLVACEFSGVVRDAFLALGFDAWSCDLEQTEQPGPHIQGSVLEYLEDGWDLMIAHPPCTHLAVSGAHLFAAKRADGRQQQAIDFFLRLANAPITRVAIENPVGIMSTVWRKPDQIIQPWQFGEDASKSTCIWLKGLRPLTATKVIQPMYRCRCGGPRFAQELGKYGCANCNGEGGPAKLVYANQTSSGQNRLGPSPHRSRERARTYRGVARAMAEQWSKEVEG